MPPTPAVHVIGGARVEAFDATASCPDINPATGEVLADVPLDGAAAVNAAVAAATEAFPELVSHPGGGSLPGVVSLQATAARTTSRNSPT